MAMNRSEIYQLLTRHEGSRNFPYLDTEGKLTIGVGHNLTDGGVSQAVINLILKEDVDNAESDCFKLPFYSSLSDTRKLVLVSMVFNIGLPRLYGFKKFLAAMQIKDYITASKEMMDSKWAKQVGYRAQELADMMLEG